MVGKKFKMGKNKKIIESKILTIILVIMVFLLIISILYLIFESLKSDEDKCIEPYFDCLEICLDIYSYEDFAICSVECITEIPYELEVCKTLVNPTPLQEQKFKNNLNWFNKRKFNCLESCTENSLSQRQTKKCIGDCL